VSPEYVGESVVVLGSAGFIGGWVARKLHKYGARLHLVGRKEADLSLPDAAEALREIFRRVLPAVIFNLVGYGVDPGERDPDLYEKLNARLPCAILEAASACKGATIVHVGSALEYGEVGGTLDESGPTNPTTLYGKTKLAGTIAMSGNARTVTARLFTVYGPGEHPGRLLPSLLQAARTGATLDLTAGNQRRDFTYVEDVAEALLRLGVARRVPGGIVNVATGRLTPVRTFTETAARVLGIPVASLRFGAIPTRVEEMSHDPVSIERLRRVIGVVPGTGIEEGIHRTAEFNIFN
jgi:nucleoside-diphosphate-sugar epimerase